MTKFTYKVSDGTSVWVFEHSLEEIKEFALYGEKLEYTLFPFHWEGEEETKYTTLPWGGVYEDLSTGETFEW